VFTGSTGELPDRFDVHLFSLTHDGLSQVQGYHHREVFTGLYILAALWPTSYGLEFISHNKSLVATWVVACAVMSTFTLLPVVKSEDVSLMYDPFANSRTLLFNQLTGFFSLAGGFLMFTVGILYLIFDKYILAQSTASRSLVAKPRADTISRSVLGVQVRPDKPL
jgi:phosphatidylinositol glycan class N